MTALGGVTVGQAGAEAEGRTLPWLHRDGNEIHDPEGNRVVLHGVNVPDPKRGRPEWGHMHTEDAIRLAINDERGWNARIIRLPMQPQDIGDHGPGSVEPVAFTEDQLVDYCERFVDPVVDLCRELGLYIMLDYHRHWPDGPDYDEPEVDEEVRLFWNVVAPRYADESHCIFEVYNEPTTPYPGAGDPTTHVDVTDPEAEETWLYWREIAQPWVDLIREHSQDHIIVIGSPRWSQWTYWAPEHEFEGENLAYTGHVYTQENMRPLDTYFGEPSEEVPVFMSEFGFLPEQGAPYLTGTREEHGQQFSDLYEEYDTIHTQAWCFDHSWTPEMLEQVYDGGDRDFLVRNSWGEWVQDFLEDRADEELPLAPTGAGPGEPSNGGGNGDGNGDGDGSGDGDGTGDVEHACADVENAVGGVELDNGDVVCDLNGDGLHRDLTASGDVTAQDLQHFFERQHRDPYDSRVDLFDFTGNDAVGQPDVVDLFHTI